MTPSHLVFAGIAVCVIAYLIFALKQRPEIKKNRERANACTESIATAPPEQRIALWLEAQSFNREIDNLYEQQRSRRDLLLEIVVIALIAFELHDASQQSTILDNLKKSSSDTARAMQTLVQDQKDSVGTQKDSLAKIKETNDIIAQQLTILKTEQEERIAEENRRPKFELWADTYDPRQQRQHSVLLPGPESARPSVGLLREPWIAPTAVTLRLVLRNVGNATAFNVTVVPKVPTGVFIRCVEFPNLWLATNQEKMPPDCSSTPMSIPPMQPRPKDRSRTDTELSALDSAYDESVAIRLTVPTGNDFIYFQTEVWVQANQVNPVIVRVACHVLN
jgi:hypothetical protein